MLTYQITVVIGVRLFTLFRFGVDLFTLGSLLFTLLTFPIYFAFSFLVPPFEFMLMCGNLNQYL